MKFHDMVSAKNPHVVFRDVTPFFKAAEVVEPSTTSGVILIRPRRWGKSVLGTAWIEFLRGRSDLFVGTWAETRMRKDKLIGVHLDMSRGGSSVGECTLAIMNGINEGLELAEEVEGYGAAKGRRLSIGAAYLQQKPTEWTVEDCTLLVGGFLNDLKSIAKASGRKVAIFVDEYDRPCINALSEPNFEDFNKFFQDFYTKIKGNDFIRFVFITGSSRLALKGWFTGPNDMSDLSYESKAATALGYVWEDIEKLYGEQLSLLEVLHGLNRDALRLELESWYNNFRWSKNLPVCVFNPLSINEFMRTGEFRAHWTETGAPSLLFDRKLFQGDLLRLLLVDNARVGLSLADLKGVNGSHRLQKDLSEEGQLSVLASSGVITIAKDFDGRNDANIPLVVANLESRIQAEQILQTTFEAFVTHSVREVVEEYCRNGNPVSLLVALDKCGELAKLALELAGREQIIEKHIHQAITILVLAARKDRSAFQLCSELNVEKNGEKKKWLDLAFWVRGQDEGYAIELECCKEPKVKENSKSKALRGQLHHGLEQLREDYKTFKLRGADFGRRLFSCALFGKDARLIAFTNPLSFEEISAVQGKLLGEEEDDRVVWE